MCDICWHQDMLFIRMLFTCIWGEVLLTLNSKSKLISSMIPFSHSASIYANVASLNHDLRDDRF